ncbi:isoprenylcysteine carboxylmethyltransferase family protein [Aquabacterium sp. A3]|uniref:methyltransferase family protein n=1 Tax=Aquabacterium sp. A3 TaxID=3132829 RepID=UPI003119AE80
MHDHSTFVRLSMSFLNNRVPPPVVALLVAALMWWLPDAGADALVWPSWVHWMALPALAMGLGFDLAGLYEFWRFKTTVNPLSPARASQLVTRGVYRITRNPMYVGLALNLLAWALYLDKPLTLLGPVAFMAYITRFQIQPEEQALLGLFGEPYAHYMQSTRRWL